MELATPKTLRALAALAALALLLALQAPTSHAQEFGACALDARQCPDGSWVTRQPPDCEFQACPASPESQAQPEPAPTETENAAEPPPALADALFTRQQVKGFLDATVDAVKFVFGDLLRTALDAVLSFTAALGESIGLTYTEIVITLLILILIFFTAKLRGVMDAAEKLSWLIIILLVIVLVTMIGPRVTDVLANLGNAITGAAKG